jgi:hypothetical protein
MRGGFDRFVRIVSFVTFMTVSMTVVCAYAAVRAEPGLPVRAAVVEYTGKMVDETGKPVSGIYPITFKLYPAGKSGRALWSETSWVGVADGQYKIALGSTKLLPPGQDFTKLLLAVEIKGKELSRAAFMDAETAKKVKAAQEQNAISQVKLIEEQAKDSKAPAGNSGSVKYADSAGYAVSADHAKNSDRIQNLTVDDLVKKIQEEGGGTAGAVSVGKTRRYGDRVGGEGGTTEYNEVCPRGYVMVGIRGATGKFLDSIQIVCAPLEAQ